MKNKFKNLGFLFVFTTLFIVLTSSCSKKDDTSTEISDDNFYQQTGAAIVSCYVNIFNEVLDNVPVGTQDTTVNLFGGTIVITGSDGYDTINHVTTTDLLFTMTGIKYSYTNTNSDKPWITEVTLTGATTYSGSFSGSFKDVNHHSDNLKIKGSVTYDGTVRNIDDAGVVDIERKTATTTVTIFGHTVSW